MFNTNKGNAAIEILPAAARVATANGTGVDKTAYIGRGMIVLNIGVVSGTNPTADVKIQDSADNSSFADISGAAFAQKTAAGTSTLAVDLDSARQYIRAVFTLGGTSTPTFNCAAVLIAKKRVV